MIAKTGAILIAIVALSFISALLAANIVAPGGFKFGESIASFFNFPSVRHSEPNCDCEYSSILDDYMCNSFCGDLSGTSCEEKADCII